MFTSLMLCSIRVIRPSWPRCCKTSHTDKQPNRGFPELSLITPPTVADLFWHFAKVCKLEVERKVSIKVSNERILSIIFQKYCSILKLGFTKQNLTGRYIWFFCPVDRKFSNFIPTLDLRDQVLECHVILLRMFVCGSELARQWNIARHALTTHAFM